MRIGARHPDLLGVALLAIVAAAVVALDLPGGAARIILGLLLVLVAPGYALSWLVFPDETRVSGIERLVLTLGLSIASVAVLGVVLNATPWGIRPVPITVGLAVTTTLSALLASRLRPVLEVRLLDRATVATVGLAMSVAVAFAAVVVGATWLRPVERATAFYVLGDTGALEAYPRDTVIGGSITVTIGVENLEGAPATFRIGLPHGPEEVTTPALPHGGSWERSIVVPAPAVEGRSVLRFHLYRVDDVEPYRTVYLHVDVRAGAGGGHLPLLPRGTG
jgi:uncharacterized membrane protein